MSTAPNKEDLVRLIEFELKRVEDARREQGWTPWLLWAALGALAWQTVGQIGLVRNWGLAGLYWAMLSLTADFLRSLVQVLGRGVGIETPKREPRFFSSGQFLSASRPYLIFTCLKISAAVVLVYQSIATVGPIRYVWAIFYGASVVGWAFIIVGTLANFPMPAGKTAVNWISRTIFVVTWVTQLAALLVMYRAVGPIVGKGFAADETRCALLVWGIFELFGLLLVFGAIAPISGQLVQLRRSLALGEFTEEEAKQRLEVVIYGAEQSVDLRTRAQAFLDRLDEFNSRQETAQSALNRFLAGLAVNPSAPERETIQKRFEAVKSDRKAAAKALSQLEIRHINFETRAIIFSTLTNNAQPDLPALRDGLKAQFKAAEAKDEGLASLLQTAEARFEEFVSQLQLRDGGSVV